MPNSELGWFGKGHREGPVMTLFGFRYWCFASPKSRNLGIWNHLPVSSACQTRSLQDENKRTSAASHIFLSDFLNSETSQAGQVHLGVSWLPSLALGMGFLKNAKHGLQEAGLSLGLERTGPGCRRGDTIEAGAFCLQKLRHER